MKKLSAKGQKWLKGIHILFACMWVGAAIILCSYQSLNLGKRGKANNLLNTFYQKGIDNLILENLH